MIKRRLLIPLLVFLGILALPLQAAAADMQYTVEAVIPENQLDKNQSYFDLLVKPGEKQTVELDLKNDSEEELDLRVEVNTAVTNKNGVIDYNKHDIDKDSSIKVSIQDIIAPNQTDVTLKPSETKRVAFEIDVPDEPFEGILLGGFYVYQTNVKESADEKNVQVRNRFSLTKAIVLRVDQQEVDPEMALNDIKAVLDNYRTAVTVNLQNTQPTMMGSLAVDAKISKKGSSEVLHQVSKENMSMAPNSNFDMPISWNNQPLEAGTYVLDLTATAKGDHKWTFTKEFTITAKDADDLNKEAVELEEAAKLPWWVFLLIALVVLLVLIIIIVFVRNKQQKKGDSQQKKRKKHSNKEKTRKK